MPLDTQPKIFGIGLPKTGTSTLGNCFEILGYKKAPYQLDFINDIANKKYQGIEAVVAKNDAFEDWPWPMLYPILAEKYPTAKFILTVRKDAFIWLNSIQVHTYRNTWKNSEFLRQQFYGSDNPWKDSEDYLQFYDKHNAEVIAYFQNQPERLLVVNWEEGDSWPELCDFLNKKVPSVNFPHANRAKSTSFWVRQWRRIHFQFLEGLKKWPLK